MFLNILNYANCTRYLLIVKTSALQHAEIPKLRGPILFRSTDCSVLLNSIPKHHYHWNYLQPCASDTDIISYTRLPSYDILYFQVPTADLNQLLSLLMQFPTSGLSNCNGFSLPFKTSRLIRWFLSFPASAFLQFPASRLNTHFRLILWSNCFHFWKLIRSGIHYNFS